MKRQTEKIIYFDTSIISGYPASNITHIILSILSKLNGLKMAISYTSLSVITWNCQSIAMLSIYQYLYQEKNHVIHGEMNMQFHYNNTNRPWSTPESTVDSLRSKISHIKLQTSEAHTIIQPSVINYNKFIN